MFDTPDPAPQVAPSRSASSGAGLGIAGFVCSLVGILSGCLGGIVLSPVGLVLSAISMKRESNGLAIAGFVLGIIGSMWLCFALVFAGGALTILGQAENFAKRQIHSMQSQGSSGHASLREFEQLRDGMTYSEVVSIIGGEGRELSRTNLLGVETVMYAWDGESGFGANMNAMFQNGRLMSKSQFGLR